MIKCGNRQAVHIFVLNGTDKTNYKDPEKNEKNNYIRFRLIASRKSVEINTKRKIWLIKANIQLFTNSMENYLFMQMAYRNNFIRWRKNIRKTKLKLKIDQRGGVTVENNNAKEIINNI